MKTKRAPKAVTIISTVEREEMRETILRSCADFAIPVESMAPTGSGWSLRFLTNDQRCKARRLFKDSKFEAKNSVRYAMTNEQELLVQKKPGRTVPRATGLTAILSDRDLASVLAGLRLLQGEGRGPTDGEAIDDIATNNGRLLALSDEEVDQLCEYLNTGTR